MSRALDLMNSRFGRLLVIDRAEKAKDGHARWTCRCECGVTKIVLATSLQSGNPKSCGCFQRDRVRECFRKHGQSGHPSRKASPTYNSWQATKQRCLYPNAAKYPKYGALGVKICDRWKDSFENFLADLGERLPGTTLGRFNDIGDYTPLNCKWMTSKEQRENWKPDRNMGFCKKKAVEQTEIAA